MLIPAKVPQTSVECDDDGLPPAYTPSDSVPAASQSASSRAPLPGGVVPLVPPTNFLNLISTNSSIKGTHVLDLSLTPPSSVPPPKDANGRPLNLRLHSTNGSIDVLVSIMRASDAKHRALLDAATTNGSIKIQVEDHHQQHFYLRAASTNGTITLRLPPTFIGPISIRQLNGRLIFSPAIQGQVMTFSGDEHDRRFFVGDYKESGYTDDVSWSGDAVCVEALNGRVSVGYTSDSESQKEHKGFFKRIFS